jgi:hypothetical protein
LTKANAAQKTADDATSSISSLNGSVQSLDTKVTSVEAGLATKANSADVVTKTSLSGELGTLANNNQLPSSIVTTGNLADKGVVTTSSLSGELADLEVVTKGTLVTKFNEALNSVGSCSVDGKPTQAMNEANALRTTLSTPSTCGTGGK